jgi:hypothetical protein
LNTFRNLHYRQSRSGLLLIRFLESQKAIIFLIKLAPVLNQALPTSLFLFLAMEPLIESEYSILIEVKLGKLVAEKKILSVWPQACRMIRVDRTYLQKCSSPPV